MSSSEKYIQPFLKKLMWILATTVLLAGCTIHSVTPETIEPKSPASSAEALTSEQNNTPSLSDNTGTVTEPSEDHTEAPEPERAELSAYEDYYRLVESIVVKYGYCPNTVFDSRGNSGLMRCLFTDFDSDGTEELLIAFWIPEDGLLKLQTFGQKEGKAKLLLERDAPMGNDFEIGFWVLSGSEYYIDLEEFIRPWDNQPAYTNWLYKLVDGEICETVLRKVYSESFEWGEARPESLTIAYYVDDKECSEQEYTQAYDDCKGKRDRFGRYDTSEAVSELKEVVGTLAERACVPQKESSALLDRISALALIYAINYDTMYAQEIRDALVEPIKDFDMVKDLALQMDLPQEEQSALVETIEELAQESAG